METNLAELKEPKNNLSGNKSSQWNRVEFQRLILAISSQFINLSPDEIEGEIDQVLRIIGEFSHADRTYLIPFPDKTKVMKSAHEWCGEGIEPQINNLKVLLFESFEWEWENLTRLKSIHIPHVADLPPEASIEKKLLQAIDIRSILLIPLDLEGVCVGLLGLDSVRSKKSWSEEEITLLKVAGEVIVNVLSHKRIDVTHDNFLQQIERIKREWESTADSLSELVFLIDNQGCIIRGNRALEKWSLGSVADVRGRKIHDLLHPGCTDPACTFETCLPQAWERLLQNRSVKWEFADRVLKRYLSVQIRPISAIMEGKRKVGFAVVTINNITGNKRKENEREKLIHELQDALANIKTLRGLLPICASCKRIRDDKGYWNQIEVYIRDHSEAEFSHGICPECKRKLYPDFEDIAE
jgi:PAS domain-containing protein